MLIMVMKATSEPCECLHIVVVNVYFVHVHVHKYYGYAM